jgi:hypothetical protein
VTDLAEPTKQRADAIAEQLQAALARAREHQVNVERADELALRLAAHEAGVPLEHPVASLFLRQYDGPVDADYLVVAWHRQVLGKEPPASVTERLRDRAADERIAQYRQALEGETENADE